MGPTLPMTARAQKMPTARAGNVRTMSGAEAAERFRGSGSEDDLLQAIVEALSFLGYVWCHFRRSDEAILMGDPGLPDVIAARNGVVWFIECKSQKGSLSLDQWRWFHEFPAADNATCRYRLWRPADLDAALAELARG